MPPAKPPLPPQQPASVSDVERDFILKTVREYYGANAVVRNYGPDPDHLLLHVEADVEPSSERYDCLGILMAKIARSSIDLVVTKRNSRGTGSAKVAYRQGVIL